MRQLLPNAAEQHHFFEAGSFPAFYGGIVPSPASCGTHGAWQIRAASRLLSKNV
jgi:hypothetical protein